MARSLRRSASATGTGLALLLLGGCADTTAAVPQEWTAPAWMAEQAQEREQFTSSLSSCMQDRGWTLTVDDSAGFAEPFTSEEEMARAEADRDACLALQGIDVSTLQAGTLTEDRLRTMYRYDIDTYECLVHEGHDLADPPSPDVYVEQGLTNTQGAGGWQPYLDQAIVGLGAERVAQLHQVCPERWSFGSL